MSHRLTTGGNRTVIPAGWILGVLLPLACLSPAVADIHYVSTAGSATPPYTSWATAANSIQDAVNAASSGETVMVSNGVYSTGEALPDLSNMLCRVAITNGLTVQSVNGPATTFIVGSPPMSSVRCAYVGTNAVLSGFSLYGGFTQIMGTEETQRSGGGAVCDGGMIRDCSISNNWAVGNGGGVYCVNGGTVRNCVIAKNTASALGGGFYCSVSGQVESCTIAANSASYGGGSYCKDGGAVENTILYGNSASAEGTNWYNSGSNMTYRFTCATPALPGTANLGGNPLFVSPAGGDFRLQYGTPCLDSGTNQAWMVGALDLAWTNRIQNDVVDIGAYEYLYYEIAATAGMYGAISPSGTVRVARSGGTNFIFTADPHYHVGNVTVDGGPIGATNDYAFTNVTGPHTISVTFAIDTYTVVVETAYGAAVPSGTNALDYNTATNATLTNSPVTVGTTQYVCVGWAGTGSVPASGSDTNVAFTVTTNSTLTWLWATNYWLEMTDASAGTNGSVAPTSDWHAANSVVTNTPTPSNGYHFVEWTGTLPAPQTNENPLLLTLDGPHSVTSHFALNSYDITATAGPDGSVDPSNTVKVLHGGSTNFAIIPDAHFHVREVVVDGSNAGPTNAWTFTDVTNTHTLEAYFDIDTNTLTVATPHGTATPPAGTNWFGYNSNAVCSVGTPVPDGVTTQYVCTGWTGTGSVAPANGSTSSVSFAMTNTSTLTWNWTTNYWLNCEAGPDGSVDVASGWYGAGSNVTITATNSLRSYFSHWTGDLPSGQTNDNPLVLAMDATHSVTAQFVVLTHYVSTSGGHVSPFTNWTDAATNIQAAVAECENGALVYVSNGTYRLTDPIVITNGIRVQSVNGPSSVTLDGYDTVRCVLSTHPSNIVDGFTITRGSADRGGGAQLQGGVMRNCVLATNAAETGGGVYLAAGAALTNCIVRDNYAQWGGGVAVADIGTLANCTLFRNSAFASGGGLTSTNWLAMQNCIVYSNTAPSGANYLISGTATSTYTCATPLLGGTGNLSGDPQLTPLGRLRSSSPCIDAGTSANAASRDFEGEARWDDPRRAGASTYDIGADEFLDLDLDTLADTWEGQQFGNTNTSGAVDTDADGLTNNLEYAFAFCPTNATSYDDTLNDLWKALYGFDQPHDRGGLAGMEAAAVGGCDTAGDARGVAVRGTTAYVADGTNGLQVFDVTTPANPAPAGGCSLTGFAYSVCVSGTTAYVAAGTGGLAVVDVSTPSSPVQAGGYATAGTAYGVCVSGTYAYVADGTNGLQIVNVSVPSACVRTGGTDTAGTAYGVFVGGAYAYVADGTNGLQVINISDPGAPAFTGGHVDGGDARGVTVNGNYAYVADRVHGLVVVDVSVPASPARAGGAFAETAEAVKVSGTNAYVAGGWGLDALLVSGQTNLSRQGRYFPGEAARDVAVSAGYAYLAVGSTGLKIARVQTLDSDQDGLPDSWETSWWGGLGNGATNDADSDAISNWGEYLLGLCPTNTDSDADGLADGAETLAPLYTDPRKFDTDGDTHGDGFETAQGTDPRNAALFPATISGTISYSGIQTGLVWVVASNAVSTQSVSLAAAGAYSISNRHTLTNYWIESFRDWNGNGQPDPWEAAGSYAGNPVALTNNQAGVDLTLADPVYAYVVDGSPSPEGAPLPYGYGTTNLPATTNINNSVALRVVNGTTQYLCIGWTNGTGSVPASGTSNTVDVVLTNASTLTWIWTNEYYSLSVTSGPNGGVVETSRWVAAGTTTTNTATPSNGYHFVGWTGDVPPADTNNAVLALLMDQGRAIMANFAINMYAVTSTAGANGSMTPSGTVQVPHGGSTNYTITPALHYHIVDVVVDGGSVGVTNAWTFSNVTNDHSISATFAIDTYTITATAGPNGSIEPSGAITVPYGGSTNFAMVSNASYYVQDVTVDSVSVGAVTNYAFLNVTTNHTIGVTFDDTYRLVVASAHGAAAPAAGTNLFKYGTNLVCTVTNAPVTAGTTQYVCLGWEGSGSVSNSGTATNVDVTLTNNSTLTWLWATNVWLDTEAGANGEVDTADGWQARGSNVTILATASNHYHFTGWTGTVTSLSNPLVLAMTQAHAVAASFSIDTYTILATAGANGSVSPSGTVAVVYDSTTNIAITPDAHYHVGSVEVDSVPVGTQTNWTFSNVDSNHTLAATFAIDTYTLVVNSPYGVPTPAAGTNVYGWNASVTCRLGGTPATVGTTQYVCTGWIGTGVVFPTGVGTNTGSMNLTNDSSVTWTWQPYYQLSVTNDPNGSVTASNGWYIAGTTATATATASNFYHFVNWTGTTNSTNNPLVVTMNQAQSLTANFALNTYPVTATTIGNGTISPSGTVMVTHGLDTNFTMSPDSYNYISNVVVDGVSVGRTNSYTFSNVTNSHTIQAVFAVSNMPLVVKSPYGTPTPPAGTNMILWNTTVNCGVAGSPVAMGTTQFFCTGWTGTGNVPGSGSGTNLNVTVITNSTLTWTWGSNYWLDTVSQPNGTVDTGDGWYLAGTSVTISASASAGYTFNGWTGDVPVGDASKNPLTLSMTKPRAVTATFVIVPYYVSLAGKHMAPFDNWYRAATSIQEAVNYALEGRTVMVSNGTFVVGSTIVVTNGITVRSLNGSGSTTIDGNNAVRCFKIGHSNAVVSGFTITRGSVADDGGGVYIDRNGTLKDSTITANQAVRYAGGVYCYYGGTVSNCTISANRAGYGGGAQCESGGRVDTCTLSGNTAVFGAGLRLRYGGLATNCTIKDNIGCLDGAGNGGGGGVQIVYTGTLQRCILSGNSSSNYGGGVYCYNGGWVENTTVTVNRAAYGGGVQCEGSGTVYRCTITGNSGYYGSGARCKQGGTVKNCVIQNNTGNSGGGLQLVESGFAANCLISANTSSNVGGGVYCYLGGSVQNCTIGGNTAVSGGGVYCESGGSLLNTIIQWNGGSIGTNWYNSGTGMTYSHCSAAPMPPGDTNLTADPKFVNDSIGDYHLMGNSPCADTGVKQPWMTGDKDLDGKPRVAGMDVDMGAYELADTDADGLIDWQEINVYGTPTNNPDADGDGYKDGYEIVAGTSPSNSAQYFSISNAVIPASNTLVLTWQTVTGRLYTVKSLDNLLSPLWVSVPGFTDIEGTGGLLSWTNTDFSAAIRFYDVKVRLKP